MLWLRFWSLTFFSVSSSRRPSNIRIYDHLTTSWKKRIEIQTKVGKHKFDSSANWTPKRKNNERFLFCCGLFSVLTRTTDSQTRGFSALFYKHIIVGLENWIQSLIPLIKIWNEICPQMAFKWYGVTAKGDSLERNLKETLKTIFHNTFNSHIIGEKLRKVDINW